MKDLAISLFGLITSLAVVAILVFMELRWEFAFYSVMHFFIIPTGAIVSGIAAAGGYYFGALLLNTRPTPKILFNMVAIAVGTYLTLNYANYVLLEVDGRPVSSLVDFTGYMDVILTSMSMTTGRGNAETGELGNLGYGIAALQILGFAGGGAATYFFLKSKSYCELCDKYYKKVWEDLRFAGEGDTEALPEKIQEVAAAFDVADVEEARAKNANIGVPKASKVTHLRLALKLQQCPDCERQLLSFETARKKGNDWEVVNELSFANVYPGTKDITDEQPPSETGFE